MADFIHMGGYGAYVWPAYAVFAIMLIVDTLAPFWQKRTTLRDLAARLRRESARGGAHENRSPGTQDNIR